MWCRSCGTDVEAEVHEADGFTCCTICGTVLEDAHFSSDVTFSKAPSSSGRAAAQGGAGGGASVVEGTFVPENAGGSSMVLRASRALTLASGDKQGAGRRGKQRLFGYQADSHEKTLSKGRSELVAMAEKLGARPREEIVDAAHRLYKLAVQRNFTRGRKMGQVTGACLYIVCRQEGKPYMLIDISDLIATNVYVLGAVFLQLCQLLRLEQHPIMQRPVDPSLFVPRFADRLELGQLKSTIAHSALRLVASMKRDWMQTGRRPSGVCGAALYIAAAMHGIPKNKRDVIAAVHVGEATLEKRLTEFEETDSGSMTAVEFEKRAIELEERQKIELEGPSLQTSGVVKCIHKSQAGVTHFALGMCRECYTEFTSMSGGTMFDGMLPPAMLHQQKLEEKKKTKMLSTASDAEDIDKEFEIMDRVIAITESRLSEFHHDASRICETTVNGIDNVDDDDDDNLSDVDDDDLNQYLNTEDETRLKQVLWEELNSDYMAKKAAKEAAARAKAIEEQSTIEEYVAAKKVTSEAGLELGVANEQMDIPVRGRRRKRASTKETNSSNDANPPEESAEAAARHLLAKKKLSSKINYAALTNLFREEPMHAATAALGTEANRRQQQREVDQRQAAEKQVSALEEEARSNNLTTSFRKAISGLNSLGSLQARKRKNLRVSFHGSLLDTAPQR